MNFARQISDSSEAKSDDQSYAAGGAGWSALRKGRKKLVTPRSVLQVYRTRNLPPVSSILAHLQGDDELPKFQEVEEAEPRRELFPQFSSLTPLILRGQRRQVSAESPQKPVANVLPAMPPSTPSSPAFRPTPSSPAFGPSGGHLRVPSSPSSPLGPPAANVSSSSSGPRVEAAGSKLAAHPPQRVGVVFGGELQAAAPVNVVAGIFKFLQAAAPGSHIFGFQDGPQGFLDGKISELFGHEVMSSLNIGGWQHLKHGTCSEGSCLPEDRVEDARRAAAVCAQERLDGIVVVGGARDLSWAAALAANFSRIAGCTTTVVGVPHSKNLNLYVPRFLPITLGFDSARRVLSEIAGNIFVDALSSNKYWHFIRCGEDSLTMEVALQTRCNFSVLTMEKRRNEDGGEDERMSLKDTVDRLKEVVERRKVIGRPSGVVLLSKQVIETLPEMDILKKELVQVLGHADDGCPGKASGKLPTRHEVGEKLLQSTEAKELFKRLPRLVQSFLISNRDADGLPFLPTDLEPERILGRFVQQALKGSKSQAVIAPRFHATELMGSAPLSSAFDCAYGYQLGHTAAALVCEKRTFYVACCAGMHQPVEDWEPCAIPFSFLYPKSSGEREGMSWPPKQIPKVGWRLRQKLQEAHRFFRNAWVECNVFKAPGTMQFGDAGELGPMSDRAFTLLAEYVSLDELKQMIQPVMTLPPPIVVSRSPVLVVRDIRVRENLSYLEQKRLGYVPKIPGYLKARVRAQEEDICPQACDTNVDLAKSFPITHAQVSSVRLVPVGEHADDVDWRRSASEDPLARPLRVGIVFTSRQAPGFHNVVAGLCDYLFGLSPPGEVIGFLGGHEGIIKNETLAITKEVVDQYRNLGGQDMLCQFSEPGLFDGAVGSLAFKERLKAVVVTIAKQRLDGMLFVGDLPSQVATAFIAEACAAERLATRVVGVPVSLDCNFPFVQQTIGYDTLCRTLSCYIGDLGNLAKTMGNQWVFIRTMGDSWSHIAIECTLRTHPNLVLMSGSQLFGQCLPDIITSLCDLIVRRYEAGNNFGVVLLPCGFALDVSELRDLFTEVTEIMTGTVYETTWDSIPNIAAKLKPASAALFDIVPRDVQYEICFGGRERHITGIDMMSISTDRLILRFVEIELQRRRRLGLVDNNFFSGVCYNMMYQARSSIPAQFDCDLAQTLGWAAGKLVSLGKSGHLVHATRLEKDVDDWRVCGMPLTSFLITEYDEEKEEMRFLPFVNQLLRKRGVVRPFSRLPPPEERSSITLGPVQFWGAAAEHPSFRATWHMQNMPFQDPTQMLSDISALCGQLQSTMALAKAESTLYAVNGLLSNAVSVLDSYKHLDDSSRRTSESLAELIVGQTKVGSSAGRSVARTEKREDPDEEAQQGYVRQDSAESREAGRGAPGCRVSTYFRRQSSAQAEL